MSRQNIIVRSDYKLALNNIDRHLNTIKSDIRCVNNLLDYYSDDKKSMMNMLDYFTGKINKHENINLVLEDGHYAIKEEYDRRKKYINKQFNNSNVWRLVLSIDKELVESNIKWKDLEIKLAKEILPNFFKKMGFEDSKKMCYQFSLHMNTKHPHFHIAFMERQPNTRGYDNSIQYRRSGKIPNNCIKYLMNETLLCIEREKKFRPLSVNLNKELDNLKKYFNPNDKNFILYDKNNILLEEKILVLGKMLDEINLIKDNKIKYNSLKDKEIIKLTAEIKNELFSNKNLEISKNEFNSSIISMNNYLKDIAKRNNVKLFDLSYTKIKEQYLDNYVLNAIINYSNKHYLKESVKVINSNDILHSIILNIYKKNRQLNRKEIIDNSFKKNYKLKFEVINSIKNINKEMEEAAEEFYKINDNSKIYY